jgi:hypothetical protein
VPLFDQVLTPGEFVDTTADNFLTSPADKDEIFHVTFVDNAADTELPTGKAAKMPTISNSPTDLHIKDL